MALLDELAVERVPASDGSALARATVNVNTRAELADLRDALDSE
jgi:molybdopterin-guanine dinucleotide biosynthesis protein A